jgi:hypothetical protein
MTPIQQGKTTERGVRLVGHRSVELHFGVCLQQNAYGGWGRGLKDTGRGLQKSPKSRVIAAIARDRKGKTYRGLTRINADQKNGNRTGKTFTQRTRRTLQAASIRSQAHLRFFPIDSESRAIRGQSITIRL